MNFIPTLRQITSKEDLSTYSEMYFNCSGLPIPEEYMSNDKNRVFAIYWNSKLIGGFILGRDINFRTIQFFASPKKQEGVIEKLDELSDYTEITCFWINKNYRTNTFLNIFVWLSMTYSLRMYGTKYLLFGTCSKSLARLYGQTTKSIEIHRDRINNKSTFIFKAHRRSCVTGMLEIISHKLKRTINTIEPQKAVSKFLNTIKCTLQSITVSHSPN